MTQRRQITNEIRIDRNGSIRVRNRTNATRHRYFIQNRQADDYIQLITLSSNGAGLVKFLSEGVMGGNTYFSRYGTVDSGGRSGSENVGQGDHYLLPIVAAALFGTAIVLRENHAITVSFGDMSSSNGSDPWSPGFQHHSGHGHRGSRSGLDVDFRYVNSRGLSFQGRNAARDMDIGKNTTIYTVAQRFGFRNNYQGTQGRIPGVTKVRGHNDHGHLGFNPSAGNVQRYRLVEREGRSRWEEIR